MANNNRIPKNVIEVTKNLTKKGRLKGRNKKETRALRGMCPHHKVNKRGHIKPTLIPGGKGYCYCRMCKAKVPTKFFDDEYVKETADNMAEINSQAKYIAAAGNLGTDMNNF